MKKICVLTLGCKVNQYESSSLLDQFKQYGYLPTDNENDADIIIINTCTVTNRTDFKSRNLLRKALSLKNAKPSLMVYATGCYAQRYPEEIRELGMIDGIIDNQAKADPGAWFGQLNYHFLSNIQQADEFNYIPAQTMFERTRAFQKIQDGCNFYCNYCAVPHARGKSRSSHFEDVIAQAELFVQNGYREIVLGGVNLGLYHDPQSDKDLADVVIALDKISGLEIIRLSSIEPQLFSARLLEAISASRKVAPHFHIPLQSGCDQTLIAMGRKYLTSDVSRLVQEIRSIHPLAAIGMDIICGFPGETDTDFRNSYDFVQSLHLSYLHAFSFSKRKGTPAYNAPNQINGRIIRQRTAALVALSDDMKAEFITLLISTRQNLKGFIESSEEGLATALSDHYIRIYCPHDKAGGMLTITPERAYQDGIIGSQLRI